MVLSTPAHEELRELGKGCVTKPTARHYQGFARGRRKRLAEPEPTVKHLLYAHRVLLTGIHLMQTGEVVANLSDVDLRGVCIAPLSVRLSLFHAFEQYEGALPESFAETVCSRIEGHPTASRALDIKAECVIFDVAKFVGLCAASNPNALETLFADERDWVFEAPAWRRLYGVSTSMSKLFRQGRGAGLLAVLDAGRRASLVPTGSSLIRCPPNQGAPTRASPP